MSFFKLEHSRLAYLADFALYTLTSVLMAGILLQAGPPGQQLTLLTLAGLGLLSWPLIEYALHRFVLHGIKPFSTWHADHHARPRALICTPTILSATLITLLVFVPVWLLSDVWLSMALTFGLLNGYLVYAATHHALHHWTARSRWMRQLKQGHALHHDTRQPAGHYGVTTALWDQALGTDIAPVAHPLHSTEKPIMHNTPSSFYVFNTHEEAEGAIHALHRAGFDVKQLSLVGKGYHSEETPVGFYTAGDTIKSWGGVGAFWGGVWGMLIAPAVFVVPGMGLVGLAGPVVSALIGALEGAVLVGGVSAIGAALSQLGADKEQVIQYETALKADKYVLMVHASEPQKNRAQAVLAHTEACAQA